MMVPSNAAEALGMVKCGMGFLADTDPSELPDAALAELLRGLEEVNAIEAVARGRLLAAFDARDVHLGDGQRTTMAWLVHCLRLTKGQAAGHLAVAGVARERRPLLGGLRKGQLLTASVAVRVARWVRKLPAEFRDQAEELLAGAALAGVDLRGLARMYAEIAEAVAGPDPDGPDPGLDRGLSLDTTLDGAGILRGDLTPQCAAMLQAVLDALSAPEPGGDRRTRAQRYHDAFAEAMKRLLASGLLPQRAGQPVKALAPPSPWTSGRPTTSPSICAGLYPCVTRAASTPEDVTSRPPGANPTT